MKIFISGPMTGIENYNYPKFDKIERILLDWGYEVVNPTKISKNYKISDIETNRYIFDKMIDEQIQAEKGCDAIVLLNGWEKSKGVKKELGLALISNMDVYLESNIGELK